MAYQDPYYGDAADKRRMLARTMMAAPSFPAAPSQPMVPLGVGSPASLGTPSQKAQDSLATGWDGFGGPVAPNPMHTMTTDQLVEAHRPQQPVGGSYARPTMDPHQAALAKGQRSLDADRQALMDSNPQNVGEGLEALGSAFNIAMRQRAQTAAAADPWSGLRETTTGAGGGFDIGGAFKRLFG